MYTPSKDHIFIAGRTLAIQVAIFVVLLASLWGFQKLYALTDKTVFPECYQVTYVPEMTDEEKGVQLLDALVNRMTYELNSTYGWSANDILFNKWVMDNRAYRQFGTYVATKMLLDNYSTVIAKLGSSDRENEDLYKARLNQFAFSPQRWGMLFIPSAEQAYKKGLNLVKKYETDLMNKKAIYNARTDDIYEAFNVILGETVFGYFG